MWTVLDDESCSTYSTSMWTVLDVVRTVLDICEDCARRQSRTLLMHDKEKFLL
ncbi:hypothetical protein A2U01_0029406 [Trifolium medium]|uniref:Uncharacterized protein n=1 Tax=Trifolium medium TaxID=97028 RepID=A0A392PA65_9FABA|nr:hypothetical protein [Trifolium medium]